MSALTSDDNLALDPRLLGPDGINAALRAGALPCRGAGAVTLIAAPGAGLPDATCTDLERRFGPIAIAPRSPQWIADQVNRSHGAELARKAVCRTPPGESCRNWSGRIVALLTLTALFGLVVGALLAPTVTIMFLTGWAILSLVSVTLLRSLAALAALRSRRANADLPPLAPPDGLPVISVLVPLFREEDIARRLLTRLAALDYPADRLDLILVLEEDDAKTSAAIAGADLPDSVRVVPVAPGKVRTKPRALNYALDFARGDIVGVWDAEDWPSPDQLRRSPPILTRRAQRWLACRAHWISTTHVKTG